MWAASVSPYRQDEVLYREDYINKEYVAITENKEYRFLQMDESFNAIVQAQTILNIQKGTDGFSYKDTDYTLEQEAEGFYSIYAGDDLIGAAYLNILAAEDTSVTFPAPFQYQVQHALAGGGGSFSYEGSDYAVDPEGVVTQDGEPYAVCSPYIIQSKTSGVVVPTELRGVLIEAVMNGEKTVSYTDEAGSTTEYEFAYDASTLSFLGLGVKFPFASWGNIINDVSNSYVLTSYWFIWIPAGVCLMLTVLAFNFVGDGLRDAFDPKMKR